MGEGAVSRRWSWGGPAIVVFLSFVKLLVHLLTAGNYGYFRDELYYMVAGERLALGYVDFPPFVALVAAATRAVLGDSPIALHFLPALAGAAIVLLAGLMAREFGGGRFDQGLAALAVLVAPSFLVFGTWLSMDAFDQLWWALASYVLLLILSRDRPRLWLLFGLVVGLGLLTKVTVLFFGLATLVALIVTPARGQLLTRWPWLGGVAFLAPYALWNASNGWPTLEFWGEYGGKVAPTSPLRFVVQQVLTANPGTLPIWCAGLYYYLFSREGRSLRPLGWIFVVLLALFVVLNAKFYYLAPAYPALFAAGALVIERFFLVRRRWNWTRPAYVTALAISGAVVAPLTVVPVLPVGTLASITSAAGGDAGVRQETRQVGNYHRISPTGSAGKAWWRPWPASTGISARPSGQARASWLATTARPGP